jgi:hypothetical protein
MTKAIALPFDITVLKPLSSGTATSLDPHQESFISVFVIELESFSFDSS